MEITFWQVAKVVAFGAVAIYGVKVLRTAAIATYYWWKFKTDPEAAREHLLAQVNQSADRKSNSPNVVLRKSLLRQDRQYSVVQLRPKLRD